MHIHGTETSKPTSRSRSLYRSTQQRTQPHLICTWLTLSICLWFGGSDTIGSAFCKSLTSAESLLYPTAHVCCLGFYSRVVTCMRSSSSFLSCRTNLALSHTPKVRWNSSISSSRTHGTTRYQSFHSYTIRIPIMSIYLHLAHTL